MLSLKIKRFAFDDDGWATVGDAYAALEAGTGTYEVIEAFA